MSSNNKSFPGNVNFNARSNQAENDDGKTRRANAVGISFAPRIVHSAPASAPKVAPSSVSNVKTKSLPDISSPKFVWKLDEVPGLPDCHVLETTAVFIPNASPSVISERISTVLRERSIEAVYENEKAKVKCVSPDGVDFRVRLYRGRGKFNHGIIVEVQRRFGASFNFHEDTMAILDSAEGKKAAPPSSLSRGGSNIPLVSDDSDQDDIASSSTSSLSMIEKMFSAHTHDTHSLGFQLLSSLSDASKCGEKSACVVARKLLEPDNVVGSKVLSLLLDKRGEEDELFKLRTSALTVLANALQAIKGDVSEILREQLQPVLIHELRGAQKNPRLAVQAARCVEMLLQKNEQADADMHAALTEALEAGSSRHAGLEEQVKKCLAMIP